MARRNIKLIVQYDGSEYHGWQTQPGFKTIQQTLRNAIESLPDTKGRIHGASRTDAGVSALGQVALAVIDSPIPTENLQRAINDRLPADIAVTEVCDAPKGFDLLNGAKSKLYRYTIYTGLVRPVLQIRHCWHLPGELDVDAMSKAAAFLVGEKDFKSFATAADTRDNTVRTIFRCDVTRDAHWILVEVEGNAFLYNMIRNIVGMLVEVGAGRCKPERMTEILEAKDRRAAGPIAPAQGLCLVWIKY
ncbi:MAG: tRNA pseudouridine(38-40) synthase TruA [Planctomycetota bacterium]|jgi:tRNA pseudouridine38-40 synthase